VRAVPSYDGAGGAVVRLEGRLDAEGALELEDILAQFLREGVRTATVDMSRVTYMSTPALHVLARGGHEFATVKGELRVAGPNEAIQQQLEAADLMKSLVLGVEVPRPTVNRQSAGGLNSLRGTSEWRVAGKLVLLHGLYESAARHPGASLTCRVLGDPAWLERGTIAPARASTVQVGEDAFGLGIGALGQTFAEASPRLGELIGAAGVVAYQPTEGSGVPDYLIGTTDQPASAVVGSGLLCTGGFETLSRFTKRPGGQPVPLSELARVCLDHSSAASVGVVMLVEVAGLVGTRLRRSPGDAAKPVRFAMPEVRDAFSITPERVHEGTVAVVTGVVSRGPDARLAPLLRPIGISSDLVGHFHAAVFEFRPVPLRTVALRPLMTKYFSQQPLRSVLHLLHDDRGAAGAGESAFLRGICWVSPIAAIEGSA
jgi:anti-anti-sigma factor